MSPISRNTSAGSAYLDLQKHARRTGRPTQELLHLYVLEGFLARLSVSALRDRLVLKGGVLLAAFGNRRPTKDVDLAAMRVSNNIDDVIALVHAVLATSPGADDGIVFDTNTIAAESIRDEEDYSGVRVSVGARIASAKLGFHVDINVGDPIWPEPQTVEIPRLLGGPPIVLSGYPIHMVHAEKIVTALQRGVVNTRWRDFGDVWTLSRHHSVAGPTLQNAIITVARHRGATLRPIDVALEGYASIAQAKWAAWRRRNQMEQLPEQFSHVLADVFAFVGPAISGEVGELLWDASARQWMKN